MFRFSIDFVVFDILIQMAETINNFENKNFNPFSNQGNILLNNNYDPDNEADFSKLDAQYFFYGQVTRNSKHMLY